MSRYRRISDLPQSLPLFPLPGALLFPRWQLPLNIFEPRYLNMVDDAMSGARLIGMVQPSGGSRERPELSRIGCAGRITSYSETDDGRYLITLTGVCRFEITNEIDSPKPYRQARPDWTSFLSDLTASTDEHVPARASLLKALKAYVAANSLQADWAAVEDAPFETLVHALAAGCPFSVSEKQALLEAPNLRARAGTLIALLEIGAGGGSGVVQ